MRRWSFEIVYVVLYIGQYFGLVLMLCAVLHCTLRRKQWLYSNGSDFGSVLLQLFSKMKSVNTEWWQITTPKISYFEINKKNFGCTLLNRGLGWLTCIKFITEYNKSNLILPLSLLQGLRAEIDITMKKVQEKLAHRAAIREKKVSAL